MKAITPKADCHCPLPRDWKVQLGTIGPDFRAVGHAIPRLGLRTRGCGVVDGLAGEELSIACLDRLPRLAVENLDDVVDVLSRMRRRIVGLDDVRVTHGILTERRRLVVAAA